MNRIACMIAAVVVAGCAAPCHVVDYQKDSTVVHIVDSIRIIDSLILVPVPEGSDKAKLPDTDTSYLRTSVAESEAFVKDGVLHHLLRNKSEAIIPIKVSIPVRIHTQEKGLIRYLREVERVEVEKELSRWQRFLQSLGWSVLIAGALWLAWKLSRIVRI